MRVNDIDTLAFVINMLSMRRRASWPVTRNARMSKRKYSARTWWLRRGNAYPYSSKRQQNRAKRG